MNACVSPSKLGVASHCGSRRPSMQRERAADVVQASEEFVTAAYKEEPLKWNTTSLVPGLTTDRKYVVEPSAFL